MKIAKVILIIIILFLPSFLFSQRRGDVNWDGDVSIIDALLIAQYYVDLDMPSLFDLQYADANNDTKVDIRDSLIIARYTVGSVLRLPPLPDPTPDPATTNPATTQAPINWFYFKEQLNLSGPEEDKFLKNGFTILTQNKREIDTFHQGYNPYSQISSIPFFITSDTMMQLFHLTYTHTVAEIEYTYLSDILNKLISDLFIKIKDEYMNLNNESGFREPIESLIHYLAVAKALIEGQTVFTDTTLAENLEKKINDVLGQISYYSENPDTSIPEYHLYKPRGHYEKLDKLIRYFQALKWLQHNFFTVVDSQNEAEANINLEAAAIMAWLVHMDEKLLKHFESINNVLTGLGGPTRFITLNFLHTTLLEHYPEYNYLGYHILDKDTIAIDFSQFLAKEKKSIKAVSLIPILHQLDFDILDKTHEGIEDRDYPSGVDVAAVLFNSKTANQILEKENNPKLLERINEIKKDYEEILSIDNPKYVSYAWYKTLSSLSNRSTSNGILQKINKDFWNLSKLNTQLSSWTEFHNDSVEYKGKKGITPKPTPLPTPEAPGSSVPTPDNSQIKLQVQYKPVSLNPFSNQIIFELNIKNNTDMSIFLDKLKILYFYDNNHGQGERAIIEYSALGKENTKVSIRDGHLVIEFEKNTGYLDSGKSSGNIQIRVHKLNWRNYNQKKHFSFSLSSKEPHENERITLLYDKEWVYGQWHPILDRGGYYIADKVSPKTPAPNVTPKPVATSEPTLRPTPTPTLPPPRNFLEPNPEFFSQYGQLISTTLSVIDNNKINIPNHRKKIEELQDWAEHFHSIAKNLQDNKELSVSEKKYLRLWARDIGEFYSDVWFVTKEDAKTSVISDIYSYNDKVYHGGLGKAQPILILVKPNGVEYSYASIGFVHSFYEIHEKEHKRISNKEWLEALNTQHIKRPKWIQAVLQAE